MSKPNNATKSPRPEQYLALGAGLHALIERIHEAAYPINDWNALIEVTSSIGDVTLIGPRGKRSLQKELEPTISQLRPILGDTYFPILDTSDFAQKAGIVLISLILRRFVPAPFPMEEAIDENTLLEIKALVDKISKRGD